MLAAVVLPDGTEWGFSYDSLGNVTGIGSPTGGEYFGWAVYGTDPLEGYWTGVTSRGNADGTWTYNISSGGTAGCYGTYSIASITDPTGNDVVYSSGGLVFGQPILCETDYYTGSASGGSLARRPSQRSHQ